MTTIALLNGTWEYHFEDETADVGANVGTRMIKYISGPVITTNELYSAIAGATDEFQAMGFKNPMLPVTPNQFTLENQAFISRKSTEKLKEGTIVANWTLTSSPDTNGNGVIRVPYTVGGGTDFAVGDIGYNVTETGNSDSGTLLDFEIEPDGTKVAWIRPDDSHPSTGDLFTTGGTMSVTSGTGSGLTVGAAAASNGSSTFTAIQAIGSVPTATEVYLIQDRYKLGNADLDSAAGGFQFWATDPDVSLGIISVLIRTQNAGVDIADYDLEVFARRYGALYDNFRLRVAAGGFSALPLASSPDINNTTGYRNTGTLSSLTGTPVAGNAIYGGTSSADEVWTYDDSTTTYTEETDDFNGGVSFTFAMEETTDFVAFGFDKPFSELLIDIDTAGTVGTVNWEFWNGSAWTDILGPETDDSTGFTAGTSSYRVYWDIPDQTNWARTSVNNGKSLYYVRAAVATAYTIDPVFGNAGGIAGYSAATKKAIITENIGPNTSLAYYLIGDLTDFSNTEQFYEYNFTTTIDTGAEALTGTVVANTGGPTDSSAGEGGTVTIDFGHTTADWDNSGTNEPYAITVDCISANKVPIAKVYEKLKYVCRRGSDDTFWVGTCAIPGEQWRGIEVTAYYNESTGSLVEGEQLTNETQSGHTAFVVADNSGGAGEDVNQKYIVLADNQTSIYTAANDDVLADSGSTDDVTLDTAGAGGTFVTHASVKQSPFGSFTGTAIFGASGVYFKDVHEDDLQAYITTDALGTLRTPPNTISFTVTNTRAGDRIFVSRDTTVAGIVDKDTYTGHATNNSQSDTTFEVTTSIDGQVPQASIIRVVETGKEEEHRYYYDAWGTSPDAFTLIDDVTPAAPSVDSDSSTQLIDAAVDFTDVDAGGGAVQIGMMIRNTTGGKTDEVWEITDLTSAGSGTLGVRQIYGTNPSSNWETGDTYEINKLIQTYDNSDYVFPTILDYEEDTGTDVSPGSISNIFVKTGGSFGVVVQVRQGGSILPYELNQTVGSSSVSVTAVRAEDTIA